MEGHDGVVLDAMASHIGRALARFGAFGRSTKWRETSSSHREWERSQLRTQCGPGGPWTGDEVEYAWASGVMLTMAASSHLARIESLLRSCDIAFPIAPVARTIMEFCGRVAWLLDPRVLPRERAARCQLAHLDDERRMVGTARSLGHPDAAKRRKAYRALYRDVGIRFFPGEIQAASPDRPLQILAQSLPSLRASQRLLSDLQPVRWNASGNYDFLSIATHPSLPMAMETFGLTGDLDPSGNLELQAMTVDYPYRLARGSLIAFLQTWALLASYRGLPFDVVNKLLREIDQLPTPASE